VVGPDTVPALTSSLNPSKLTKPKLVVPTPVPTRDVS